MTAHAIVALVILAAATLLFLTKWLPLEVTALSIPVVLWITGVLHEPDQLLSGFASDAVVAIAAVFVIGAGLKEAGVTSLLARLLQRMAGTSEMRLVLAVMIVACIVSAFMPNSAAVAVLLPAVVTLSRRTGVSASRLLMPLAFAAVLGGNLTLIGATPNLIVAESGATRDVHVGMFDFLPIGLPMAVAGVAFMATWGRKLLPERHVDDRIREALLPEAAAKRYELSKRLFHMRLLPASRPCGRTIAEAGLRGNYGLDVVAVVRVRPMGRDFLEPRPDLVLASGDELYVEGDDEAAFRMSEGETVQMGLARAEDIEDMLGRGMTIAEVTLAPHGDAAGKTLKDLRFRARHGLNVLALWRGNQVVREDLADVPLQLGDAFLVAGKPQRLQEVARDADFILLTEQGTTEDRNRAPLALILLLVAILPPTLMQASPALSALAAAILMVASGCLSIPQALRGVDWKVVFLVIGVTPLGLALTSTGVSDGLAQRLVGMLGPFGAQAAPGLVFIVAMAVAMVTTNATSAVIVSPVALALAQAASLPVEPLLLAVAFGSACAFVLPVHQCNLQVTGPGGYVASDFVRVGLALTAVVSAVGIALLVLG